MKLFILYIILFTFFSCKNDKQYGVWMSTDNEDENYTYYHISDDSIQIREFHLGFYWNHSEPLILKRVSRYKFKNEWLQTVINNKLDEIYFTKNDTTSWTAGIKKINEYSPDLKIDQLVESLQNSQLSYSVLGVDFNISIFNEQSSFMLTDTMYFPNKNTFDIWRMGDEIFLIPNTGRPTPIQIVGTNENKIIGVAYWGNTCNEVIVSIDSLPYSLPNYIGTWVEKDFMDSPTTLVIQDKEWIVTMDSETRTYLPQILSDSKHVLLTSENQKTLQLRTEQLGPNQLKITNFTVSKADPLRTIIYNRLK